MTYILNLNKLILADGHMAINIKNAFIPVEKMFSYSFI